MDGELPGQGIPEVSGKDPVKVLGRWASFCRASRPTDREPLV